MREKISRVMIIATVVIGIIAIWFSSNIIRLQMDIPYRQSDWPLVVWSRFCAVMWVVAALSVLRWPMAIPVNEGQFLKRSFLLAALGGLIAAPIVLRGFPHVSPLGVVLAPILLAVFGGVQTSLIGVTLTSSMLAEWSSEKK